MRIKSIFLSMALLGALSVSAATERMPGQPRPTLPLKLEKQGVNLNAPAAQTLTDASVSRQVRTKKIVDQADPSLFEGRTIFGALISSNAWDGMMITEVPYGIYSFQIGKNPTPAEHISDMGYCFKGGAWGRDNFYGIVILNVMGAINGSRHIQIDTQNWTETSNVMHEPSEGSYSLATCSMCYDPTNDTFYAFRYKEDLSGLDWVKVDPEISDYEQIAAYRGKTAVLALAATPDGQMYYIDTAGDLYTINKDNGRTSLVANTGVTPAAYDQCMVYDNRSGSFLWAALSNEGSVLYSVDPATAETKRVMKFRNGEQFVALYITDSDALPGAPAAVGRPQLKFSSDGALDGNLTFNVPSKTYSGGNLPGKVNLNVWLDGNNLKGEDVDAGSAVSIPLSLEEGNHYIDITTRNEVGFSPMRYIYKYAGYDTPKAPGNARMEFAGNTNKVSWDVPEGGINAGYVDFDNITYDVVRMPDNVKVASGLKSTTFSEATPVALQSYYYHIYAVNNSHRSEYSETNRVLCGDAFPVPYFQSFEEEATFNDFFKVLDNDGSGSTWRYGFGGEIRLDYIKNQEHPFDADDWLILPKVSMEDGVKYRFHMNMKTFTPNYPEDFEILIGTNPEDIASFKSIKKEIEFTEIASEFGDYTTDFTVDAKGDYNIAVRYCSRHDENSSLMMIRNVGIDKIGMAGAPAQVSDLTIIPDADDRLIATVSFKTPATNLVGETISSITSITVTRDEETTPVYTFTSAKPGEQLSWTDENVPTAGMHTYTVVASNEAGTGEQNSAEKFVGIYTAPYTTDFSDKHLSKTLWTSESNIEDNDNGWYGWSWNENETSGQYYSLYYYLMNNNPVNIWLFSPRFKMEDNTVYTVSYNGYLGGGAGYPDIKWQLACGDEPSAEKMEKFADLNNLGYVEAEEENMLVVRDGKRMHIGFGASGATQFDYFSAKLNGFSLTRRASALAPYQITNFKSEADKSGELKATLEFNVPDVNYFNEKLEDKGDMSVKIYQGKGATIPIHSMAVKPGEKVKWTDEKALHGLNYYRITCENAYGAGEVFCDTIFVGRDVPALIENYALRADAGNANVRISWEKPTLGENGGLVLESETKYNVYSYDPTSGELSPIAENVEGNTYMIDANFTRPQQMFYYAVSAVNTEGEGRATASGIVLGKLYDLPFAESFANSAVSTQLWQAIPMMDGATSVNVTNPEGNGYNGCQSVQDNDGGCIYIYNGMQYETPMGGLLVSPKIKVSKEGGNELSFWAYHYKESPDYQTRGYVTVAVSANDSPSEILTTFYVGEDKETGWTEHKVNFDSYKNADYLSFVIMGVTPGYQDVIYLDNFKFADKSSGIEGISEEDSASDDALFSLDGIRLKGEDAIQSGSIVIKNGKKILNTGR